MKNLYTLEHVNEVLHRINNLGAESQRLWGTMNAAQMLAHCSIAMEVATSQRFPKRLFIGRIIAPLFKSKFYDESDFRKNSPTDPTFVVSDSRDLQEEKDRLKALIQKFHDAGAAACTTHPHSFFGHLTPEQWSIGMYKHLDHHLRQFGA